MEDILNELFAQPEALQWVATVAAGLVMAAITAVIVFTGLKVSTRQFQQARFYWSKAYPLALAQLDEDTDWFPSMVDMALDVIRKADWQPAARRFGRLIVEAINTALAEPPAIMPDGTRLETIADMGTAPAIGVGVGVGDAADREAAG